MTTYVCQIRDVECGSNPANWCREHNCSAAPPAPAAVPPDEQAAVFSMDVNGLSFAQVETLVRHVKRAHGIGDKPVADQAADAIDALRAEILALRTALSAMIEDSNRAERAQAERVRVLRKALDKIASWDEGPVVTGTFDEPHAAMVARAALKETNGR